MINDNLPVAECGPIDVLENRLNEQLVHSRGPGKHIGDKELEELALKIYSINGKGITFSDVVNEFSCSKRKAQLRLKNGKKSSILFTINDKRTKPQQYFPSCRKATIIENKRKRKN